MFTLRPLSWFGLVLVLALAAGGKSMWNDVPDDECDNGSEDVPWLPED